MKNHQDCAYCKKNAELRPYGINSAMICFDCAMKPENIRNTEKQFMGQLEASGPVVLIGEETGPRPFIKSKDVN